MKTFVIIELIVCAILIGFLIYVGSPNSGQLIRRSDLREDHLMIEAIQTNTANLMDAQHRELNRKLDLLLNIATNQVDGVRRMP